MEFEEQYGDVLQNVEFGIVQVYRQQPDMVDWDVTAALEALIRYYNAETRGKPAELHALTGTQAEIVQSIKAVCDWRLGRKQLLDENEQPLRDGPAPLTPQEIAACLKRIRKSVELHTRRDGRRGYLAFIVDYVK